MTTELNDATFDQTLTTTDVPVLVDFYASWCQPCRVQLPIVERLAETSGGEYQVYKVDVDEAPGAAQRFDVRSIPTLIVFRDGEPAARFTGVQSEDRLRATLTATATATAAVDAAPR